MSGEWMIEYTRVSGTALIAVAFSYSGALNALRATLLVLSIVYTAVKLVTLLIRLRAKRKGEGDTAAILRLLAEKISSGAKDKSE